MGRVRKTAFSELPPDADEVRLTAADGVPISAVHVAARDRSLDLALVVVHGFTGAWQEERVWRVADRLRSFGGVVAVDQRGHGRSGGQSSVGDTEVFDVAAAVAWARDLGYARVVTVGFSLGGAIVVREAALLADGPGRVDAVVLAPGKGQLAPEAALRESGAVASGRNVKILPVRVLGKCGGWDSDIVAGMNWAAGLSVPGLPANPNPAKVLNLSLGLSHPVNFPLPQGLKVEIPGDSKGTVLVLTCSDKEVLGQAAAKIRGFRPPSPYGGKGVRFRGEKVREKAGKAADKAQDSSRRLAAVSKQILTAQTRLKELAIVVADLDAVRAFVLDGSAAVNLSYGTWHWGPYPIGDHVDLLNLQGRGFANDNEVAHLERDLGTVVVAQL